jgi:hypothetical protein
MRKRTPEESVAYFRAYRARKKAAAEAPATPSPKKGATPAPVIATPTPCPSCATHSAALAIAQERISMLEGQLAAARRTVSATPSHRINTYGKNPCIGVASR